VEPRDRSQEARTAAMRGHLLLCEGQPVRADRVDLGQRAPGTARAGAAGRWSASSAAAAGAASPSGSPLGDALTAVAAFVSRSPGTASPGQICGPSSAGFTWPMARRPCQANHLPPGRAPSSPQPLPRRLRDHERAVRDARRATEKRDSATMSTNRLPCARNPRFYMHVLTPSSCTFG
jgi:hypothetical protein